MSSTVEYEVFQPKDGFYLVEIEIQVEDSDTGKVKKQKELHLVDGFDPTTVQKKVNSEMEGTLGDWKITNMKASKIACVY